MHQLIPLVAEENLAEQTYKSRWGYHPCDYETSQKIRRISKAYWEAKRGYCRWRRWQRKTVHRHGPEPTICEIFFTKEKGCLIARAIRSLNIFESMLVAAKRALLPKEAPEQVARLPISLTNINEIIAKLDAQEDQWVKKHAEDRRFVQEPAKKNP
jgi:hypothetical protein